MKINVFIEKENKNKTINTNKSKISDLLKELNINPTTVIITKDNEVITEDTNLKNKDKIEILSVVSGG